MIEIRSEGSVYFLLFQRKKKTLSILPTGVQNIVTFHEVVESL